MTEENDLVSMMLASLEDEPKSRDEYVRSPIPWPGCKFDSLSWITENLPRGRTFVDGCAGSGTVLLNLKYDYPLKVMNDRHQGITTFFRCIRDPLKKQQLIDRLKLTIHSREEFLWSRDSWDDHNLNNDDVERAARWYYSVRMSFGKLGRNFARAIGGPSQFDAALKNSLELFPLIHASLYNVQVENLDVIQCIIDYDSQDTVFYIDPDYIDTTIGLYTHTVEHKKLLTTIFQSSGYFAVSGYANKIYDGYDWSRRLTWKVQSSMRPQVFNDSNSLANKANVMGGWEEKEEVLWIKEPYHGNKE